jgi:hypothetical protein
MFRRKFCALLVLVWISAGPSQAEFQVNTYTPHSQTHPAVAINEAGDFVVAWRSVSNDGRGGGVYARCFTADGAPMGPEFKANVSQVDVDNWTPAVAISPGGDFVVLWAAVTDGHCDLLGRLFDLQGQAVTDEFRINEPSPKAGQSMPCIAMDSTGRFVAAWTRWSDGCYAGKSHVVGRVFQSDGTPAGGEFVVSDNTNADWPDISMDESGRFVVAWIRMGDTYNRPYGEYIMFRRYDADGTPAGQAVQITADLNCRWYGPSVAMDGSGAFAVTWAMGPFPCDIVAQHFDSDGVAVTEPYMVNTHRDCNQGHPRIAGDGQGEYLIVWDSLDQDGSCSGVYGQRCTQSGDVIGGEFQINTFVQDRQWYADVATAGDKYVVVWTSQNQDGSDYGIFGELVSR